MQFETHQNYQFQAIRQTVKNVGKIPEWGLYGPHTQFSPQLKVGLRMSTRASVYLAVLACTRVHFKNLVTREVLYYRPRNQTLV